MSRKTITATPAEIHVSGNGCALLSGIAIWLFVIVTVPWLGILLAVGIGGGWLMWSGHRSRSEKAAWPEVTRFVQVYCDRARTWPVWVTIPPADIEALRTILAGRGVSVPTARLRVLVDNALRAQLDEHFACSFEQRYPQNQAAWTKAGWARAYVDTFENNLNYLPYLERLARARGARLGNDGLRLAVESEIRERAERRRVDEISRAMSSGGQVRRRMMIGDVDLMNGVEFEHFLGDLFRALGYQARVTQASGDQGADLILEKFGERTVVQAKCYSSTVSNSAIQEAVAAKAHYQCRHAVVVTNNYFTKPAQALAVSNGVDLWDRDKLEAMIGMYL
jgi:hypothetical protein